MIRWVVRRLISAGLVIVVGITLLVALVHSLPGDPLTAIVGERALDPDSRRVMEHDLGIGRPLPVVITTYFQDALHGDLGTSLAERRPVTTILAERLGPTLVLGGLTLLVDFTLGLLLGVWSALHSKSRLARLLDTLTLATYTVPGFVIGLVLIWWFAVHWHWFPPAGIADPLLPVDAGITTVALDRLRHLALPLVTMVLATIAVPIRQQRSAVLASMSRPWVTAARARGVSVQRITWQHIWRPALTPVISLLGLWLPMLVSGAVFVETVFAYPGIGALLANATSQRDIPVVIGAGVVLVVMVQVGSLVADILYRVVDPVQREMA
ncbi:MAG: ABC transporter permease [Gemmatimonadota bacterium]